MKGKDYQNMRNVMELKDNWMFVKEAENAADAASKKGTAVSLPHTWNAVDGQDGGNDTTEVPAGM